MTATQWMSKLYRNHTKENGIFHLPSNDASQPHQIRPLQGFSDGSLTNLHPCHLLESGDIFCTFCTRQKDRQDRL